MKTEKQLIQEIIKTIDGCINSNVMVVEHHKTYNHHKPQYAKDAQVRLDRAINWKENFAKNLTENDIKYFREVFLNDEVILMVVTAGTKIFKGKKVDIDFIKEHFPLNITKILKDGFVK